MTCRSSEVQLTVTLPAELAAHLQERVSSGNYADESDYICQMLLEALHPEPVNHGELERWIAVEGVRLYDEMKANPSLARTEEEAFAFLKEQETFEKAS